MDGPDSFIDALSHMTALDVLLIILWGATAVWGLFSGIIRQAFVLGAVLSGIVLGAALGPSGSEFLAILAGMDVEAVRPFAYFFIVVGTAALFYLATRSVYPHTRLLGAPGLDSIGGGFIGLAGGLVGNMELANLLALITAGPWAILDGARASIHLQIETTPFLPWLASVFPHVATAIRALSPT